MTDRPDHLRVEHLDGAVLGTWAPRPRLSWHLPSGAALQHGYDIETDDGRSLHVDSGRHVLVPWPFSPLTSRERVAWRVRTHTDAGVSDWSAPAWVEAGLLDPTDWSARWIEPDEPERRPPGERPAWYFRHEFDLESVAPARLYTTAHGIHEVVLNGRRVGDHELAPGFTSYANRLAVQTYDVGDLLVEGPNVWEVILTDGWYRGRNGNSQLADGFGETVAVLGQLEVGGATVATGPDWVAGTGPVTSADLMAGQCEDRRIPTGGWRPVRVVDHGLSQLTSSPAPPIRRVEEIRPRSIRSLGAGVQIVDLGQNINGWTRLTDLGPLGTETRLVHGEALDPTTGDVTTAHLEMVGLPLGQVDRVVSAGAAGDVFEPRHTTHGFQYVRVEGRADPLSIDDVRGVVVHTDLRRAGGFRCSDERVNRLHEIADWSFRDNACGVPTDCPHRERSGWTGDWQLFLPTAAFLHDVAGFSVSWLRDLAAEQLPDGVVLNFAPDPRRRRAVAEGDIRWRGLMGSSGWGDATVIVPWLLHQLYGDDQILAETWPMMNGWLDHACTAARTQRFHTRSAARPAPAAHEEYLWDAGWHWGEWCEPAHDGEPWYAVDQGHVATAYLHRSASLAAGIGRLLGHHDRAADLDRIAAGALAAWRAEYVTDDGRLTPDTQANHVRALAFDLVPDELRARTATRLVELIREAGTHLGTGFLATPDLLPVLADHGHLDVAYELLLQDTPPSWLTMVDRGATTIWESWEGIDQEGHPHESLNHYSKGAVISFLHRYVAGIRPVDDEPAYRRFRVAPEPGGDISWAEAWHDAPGGRITSSWRIDGDRFELTVTVPSGSSAEIEMPDATSTTVGPGTSTLGCRMA